MSAKRDLRAVRLREIIGAVARQALQDRGAERIALLDDASPEAQLAAAWLVREIGGERVIRVGLADERLEPLLQALRAAAGPLVPSALEPESGTAPAAEIRRTIARLVPGALIANPANKTGLLLNGAPPPDPFFPLGDLYASEVRTLTGACSLPSGLNELSALCGGVVPLDAALRQRLDHRDPEGLRALGAVAEERVAAALARGRAARVLGAVVPKVGSRTLGIDLFE